MDDCPPSTVEESSAGGLREVVGRWTPIGLREARTDPGRRGAVALVGVALLAALAVAVYVWHGRPQPQAIGPPPVVTGAAPTGPAASPTSARSLVVAISGKVRRPGVVTVPAGARVIDVLKAAGGPLPGADIGMLNLARKVADGELVTVGVPAPAPAGSGSAGEAPPGGDAAGGPTAPIDLNTATLAELDTLPGVGPVLAQRILDWRTEHGRFATVDQLSDVPGIGDARLAQLRDLVQV
jgi:competence protein ComEA